MQIRSVLAAIMAVFLVAGSVHASVIVADDFTGADGTSLAGRTPPTDLPDSTYTHPVNGFLSAQIVSNAAQFSVNTAVLLDLTSSGTYVKPTTFSIQADIKLGNAAGTGTGPRVMLLGFYDVANPPGNAGESDYYGLAVDSAGGLGLSQNAVYSPRQAFTGTFDANTFYTLKYTVNTLSGTISDVTFNGNPYTFATTSFTDAHTHFASLGISAENFGQSGYEDNFSVNTVPEPATIGSLLALGGLSAMARRRR